MRLRAFSPALLAALAALAGCASMPAPGLDRAAMDPAVRPQDDLFLAANGRWLAATAIPPDKSDWGAVREMRDRADERVKAIVEALGSHAQAQGSAQQKVADFYAAWLDEAAIDRAGLAPLKPWLDEIDAATSPSDFARLMGRLQGLLSTPVDVAVRPDPAEPGVYRALTWQGGLGLPDRDYYLKDDERFAQARAAYLSYVEKLLALSGEPDPAGGAKAVLAFEKRLAEAHWPRADSRDPVKRYNPMTPAQLAERAPGFDWAAFFSAAALPPLDKLSVSQPSVAEAFAREFAQTPAPQLRRYLRVHLLDEAAAVLPRPFREARFDYRERTLRGQTQPLPRWQQSAAALNEALGEAVGQLYVQQHFPPDHKARMQALVANLFAAYRESLATLAWMGPETKQRAQQKLSKYGLKIGYPEVWRDYSGLQVRPGDALGNTLRARRFDHERRATRAGQAVDRREWSMTPQTVNAYYSPPFNEIVFPAAILEPPFFDMAADDAFNYGAIGSIIGHEISHGFDDSGSRYDGDGRLSDWWTEADRKAFQAVADKLAAQYDGYVPVPGHPVNGRLTLGENIADLSGLEIALKAYRRSLGGRPAPVVDGLSGEQRFFLAYAQTRRTKIREARLVQLIASDPHSPPQYRANGPVVNIDAFHEDFGTRPGDGLWKPAAERLHFW